MREITMHRAIRSASTISALCLFAPAAIAQDSVSSTPGTSDALSSYDAGAQILRYAVDLTPLTSSWGNAYAVAPIVKASADPDPMFDTQLVGAVAMSPDVLSNILDGNDYATWSAAGAGVNPSANGAPATVSVPMFRAQFSLGLADLSAGPTNAVGAIIGTTDEPNRVYVTRTVGAVSRFTSVSADNATIALGSIDADGNMYARADDFNTTGSSSPLSGDNVLRIDLPARNGVLNALLHNAGSNTALDTGATSYVAEDSAITLNTPAAFPGSIGDPAAMVLDFAGGATVADSMGSAAIGANLASGIDSHRGNPSTSTLFTWPGQVAYASLARSAGSTTTDSINAFTLGASANFVLSDAATLPSPITDGAGFTANTAGDASFHQYLSQQSFRGANGQAAISIDPRTGQTIAAATALDPTMGEFIAVCQITEAGEPWTVAAYEGKPVLDGEDGTQIGVIATAAPASISAPAIDELGNIYFVAAFDPTAGTNANALIKAVNTASGYQLELLLKEGDSFTGANSATPYTIDRLTLADSDSLASGSFYSGSIVAQASAALGSTDQADPRSFTGASVAAQITYDNAGTPETYDVVLFVAPSPADSGVCAGDCDNSGAVNFADLVAMLFEFGTPGSVAGCDADDSGTVNFSDLVAALFLFGPCP